MKHDSIRIIIPLENLPKAEEIFPETAMLVGPYLNSISNNDYNSFYEDLIRIVQENRGDDEVIKDYEEKEILKHFDSICDDMVTAFEEIKYQAEHYSPADSLPEDYEIESSRKLNNNAVELIVRHKGG